jgi:hypothetical protein
MLHPGFLMVRDMVVSENENPKSFVPKEDMGLLSEGDCSQQHWEWLSLCSVYRIVCVCGVRLCAYVLVCACWERGGSCMQKRYIRTWAEATHGLLEGAKTTSVIGHQYQTYISIISQVQI